jgi:putative Mg2+ transporter-C (MgtC) family protein
MLDGRQPRPHQEAPTSGLDEAAFAARLAVGVGCGAVIDAERQRRAPVAGLRTNALVAAGATLFVRYSVAARDPGNATRVAS